MEKLSMKNVNSIHQKNQSIYFMLMLKIYEYETNVLLGKEWFKYFIGYVNHSNDDSFAYPVAWTWNYQLPEHGGGGGGTILLGLEGP